MHGGNSSPKKQDTIHKVQQETTTMTVVKTPLSSSNLLEKTSLNNLEKRLLILEKQYKTSSIPVRPRVSKLYKI